MYFTIFVSIHFRIFLERMINIYLSNLFPSLIYQRVLLSIVNHFLSFPANDDGSVGIDDHADADDADSDDGIYRFLCYFFNFREHFNFIIDDNE